MNDKLLLFVFIVLFNPILGFSQSTTQSQNQLWLGYMTSTSLNQKYSLWNDIHYVPGGFFLLRTGITKNINSVNFTVGYAYGRLPTSSKSNSLNRQEHRPWFQLQTNIGLGKQFFFIPRFRYDGRFRQDIENGSTLDSYSFTSRLRFMTTFRKFITEKEVYIGKPFIGIGNELLLNFGKNVSNNHFDQNRFYILAGTQFKHLQIQTGYMNRFVQSGAKSYTTNHTLVIWVTQQFHWTKKNKAPAVEHDSD